MEVRRQRRLFGPASFEANVEGLTGSAISQIALH